MSADTVLPDTAEERNLFPMADGLLYYFPNALAMVSRVSAIGNEQHNPGEPMHWAREKSTDHANKILRHLIDAGTMDKDGTRHSAKVAWRALALLEDELIEEGATPGRNARITNGWLGPVAEAVAARFPAYLVDPSGEQPPVQLERTCPSSRHSTEGTDEVLSASIQEVYR